MNTAKIQAAIIDMLIQSKKSGYTADCKYFKSEYGHALVLNQATTVVVIPDDEFFIDIPKGFDNYMLLKTDLVKNSYRYMMNKHPVKYEDTRKVYLVKEDKKKTFKLRVFVPAEGDGETLYINNDNLKPFGKMEDFCYMAQSSKSPLFIMDDDWQTIAGMVCPVNPAKYTDIDERNFRYV